jgi:hypothetical protein
MLDKGNSFAASTNYHVLFTILLYEIRTPPYEDMLFLRSS